MSSPSLSCKSGERWTVKDRCCCCCLQWQVFCWCSEGRICLEGKKIFKREGFRRSKEKKREKHTEVVKRRKEVEDVNTSIIPEGKKTHTRTPSLCGCVSGDSVCLLCSSVSTLYVCYLSWVEYKELRGGWGQWEQRGLRFLIGWFAAMTSYVAERWLT